MSELSYQGLRIVHPSARERENGTQSRVFLSLSTPSGRLREVDLTDAQLMLLIETSAKLFRIRNQMGRS